MHVAVEALHDAPPVLADASSQEFIPSNLCLFVECLLDVCMMCSMVWKCRRRPLNVGFDSIVSFIFHPLVDPIDDSSRDILRSINRGKCAFQLGKGRMSRVTQFIMGAPKDVILCFIVMGRQEVGASAVRAFGINRSVPFILACCGRRPAVGKVDDSCSFKIG